MFFYLFNFFYWPIPILSEQIGLTVLDKVFTQLGLDRQLAGVDKSVPRAPGQNNFRSGLFVFYS